MFFSLFWIPSKHMKHTISYWNYWTICIFHLACFLKQKSCKPVPPLPPQKKHIPPLKKIQHPEFPDALPHPHLLKKWPPKKLERLSIGQQVQELESWDFFRWKRWWLRCSGWTNPFEKYVHQIGSYPQGLGLNIKKQSEKTTNQATFISPRFVLRMSRKKWDLCIAPRREGDPCGHESHQRLKQIIRNLLQKNWDNNTTVN